MGSLSDKFALVTGGSRGIGAAIAKHLAREGAHVLVNYARGKERAEKVVAEIVNAGGRASAVQGDVGSNDGVATLFREVDKVTGARLDILVNNAGVFSMKWLAEDNVENFDSIFSVNVRGLFLVTKAAEPRLANNGRIINIGSTIGESVLMPGVGVYAASKWAIHGFTRAWARDLAPRGITVNTVSPGPIDTDMNPADGEHAASMASLVPLGRYGKAEEVAAVVAFLASPAASYVSAATINAGGAVGA